MAVHDNNESLTQNKAVGKYSY